MDTYISQSQDVVDQEFIDAYRDYIRSDIGDIHGVIDMLISAGHYNRFVYILSSHNFRFSDPNWQCIVISDIFTLCEDYAQWLDAWFTRNNRYTKKEILNRVIGERGLLLNYLLERNKNEDRLETVLKRAIIAGCDPLSSVDGTPPVIAIYEHCCDNFNQSEVYMRQVVFDHIEVTGEQLDNARLLTTGENLLHIAATRRDNEGLEYFVNILGMNVDSKFGSKCGFDNYTEHAGDNIIASYQFWFYTLHGNLNLMFTTNNRDYSIFTKYCGLKDPTIASMMFEDGADVHLGTLNPALVCASLGHHQLTLALINKNVSMTSYDATGSSVIFYMIEKYHSSYLDVFKAMHDEFLSEYITHNRLKWTIVHTVAAMGPTSLLRYLIGTRNIPFLKADARGFDILLIAIMRATQEMDSNILDNIYKNINYLVFEVGVKPDVNLAILPSLEHEQTVVITSVEAVLAALLHYTHRVSITYEPLPPLQASIEEDLDSLEDAFEKNDKYPDQTPENVERVKSALDHVYLRMPWLKKQLLNLRAKIIVAQQEPLYVQYAPIYIRQYENVMLKQKAKFYELAVRMIEMSRHINPVVREFFYKHTLFSQILNRGMTLRGISTPAAVQATGGALDPRFRWF